MAYQRANSGTRAILRQRYSWLRHFVTYLELRGSDISGLGRPISSFSETRIQQDCGRMRARKHGWRVSSSCGLIRIVSIKTAHQNLLKPSTRCSLGTFIRGCALRISPIYQHLGIPPTQRKFPAVDGSQEVGLYRSSWLLEKFCSTQPIGRSLAQDHLWRITYLRPQASTSNISTQNHHSMGGRKISGKVTTFIQPFKHPSGKDFHGWLAARPPYLRIWHTVCSEFSAYLCPWYTGRGRGLS